MSESNWHVRTQNYRDPQHLAVGFTEDLSQWIKKTSGQINVALSGGSTPQQLFRYWAGAECPFVDWSRVHFFWGDERCVPPDHSESNYGVANSLFFQPKEILKSNIHRIRGEQNPESEAIRYAKEVRDLLESKNGLPEFDVLILGMGSDGHTASIFPDQMELLDSTDGCAVAKHPDSGQLRITLTGPVIANARRIAFLITGDSKTEKLAAILQNSNAASCLPAARFINLPAVTVYLDEAARGNH